MNTEEFEALVKSIDCDPNLKKVDTFKIRKDLNKNGSFSVYYNYLKEQHTAFWNRVLDEGESAKLFFEGYGVCPLRSQTISTEKYDLTEFTYFMSGKEWKSIQEVSARLSLMSKFTMSQYNALMEAHGFTAMQKFDYYAGTTVLATVMHSMNLHRQSFMNKHAEEFIIEGATDHLTTPSAHKQDPDVVAREVTLCSVPPRLPYDHAGNVLYQQPQFEELPVLNEAWNDFIDKMRNGPNPKLWAPKQRLPKPEPLGVPSLRLNHPEYGKYGYYEYALKEEFTGSIEPQTMYNPTTYSTALDAPIPAFMPRWNRRSAHTNLHGGAGRLGRLPVKPELVDYATMDPYLDEAGDLLIDLLAESGLPVYDQLPTPELAWRWLASTSFPAAKKFKYAEAFLAVEAGDSFVDAEYFSNVHKAFPKNELYAGLTKPQRQILAGDYQMAAVLGPMCDIIGNYFFSREFTSKKIPERIRPRIAIERFGRNAVILNDMSAYEGSINPHIKEKCEHKIFKHFFPQYEPWLMRCLEDLNLDVCGAKFSLPNCRCSGDPQTSLGNSITNIISIIAAYSYACDHTPGVYELTDQGLRPWRLNRNTMPVAWVEGDDSLVKYDHNFEKPGFLDRYTEAFIKMGFATKMEVKDFVGNAGYCSMFFTDKARNAPSLGQTLLDFPWCHNGNERRGKEYLALKALSLANSAPGQPLAWAVAAHYAPTSNLIASVQFNAYEYEELVRENFDVRIRGSKMDIYMNPASVRLVVPDDDDRRFFTERYLISAEEQRDLERLILEHGVSGIMKTKKGDFFIRQICASEGLPYDDFVRFYNDNVDAEVMIEEQHYEAAVKNYKVVEGRIIEEIRYPRRQTPATVQYNAHTHRIREVSATEKLIKESGIIPYKARKLYKLLAHSPKYSSADLLRRELRLLFDDPPLHWWTKLYRWLFSDLYSHWDDWGRIRRVWEVSKALVMVICLLFGAISGMCLVGLLAFMMVMLVQASRHDN